MTEPTLEEKLLRLSKCTFYFEITNEFNYGATQRTFNACFDFKQSKKNVANLLDAINWLYETAKREGYLE